MDAEAVRLDRLVMAALAIVALVAVWVWLLW